MKKITPERLRELLTYDPLTGIIRTKSRNKLLIEDHDGLVILYDGSIRSSYKLKLEKIAYALAFGVIPEDNKRILHRNLNKQDNRLNNLQLVSRATYLEIKEAYRNLTTGIRFVAHPTDQFCYNVYWFEKGIEKCKLINDIVSAQEFALSKRLKYSKILTKFCVFD